jgi:hypothetical protein
MIADRRYMAIHVAGWMIYSQRSGRILDDLANLRIMAIEKAVIFAL